MNKKFNLLMIIFFLLISACSKLPEFKRTYSYSIFDTDNTVFGKLYKKHKKNNSNQSAFYPLHNALDAFVARMLIADKAEKTLDVQYYIYNNDLVGKLFTRILIKAANRGVRVRLLLDDMNLGSLDNVLYILNKIPNIEVRIFNPFSRNSGRVGQLMTSERHITRRMHNKSLTADSRITILGGRNMGNEYFLADPEMSFADLDVIGLGPIAEKVSKSFDLYWNSNLSYPIDILMEKEITQQEIDKKTLEFYMVIEKYKDSDYVKALKTSDLFNKIQNNYFTAYWGDAEVLYDMPDKISVDLSNKRYNLTPQLRPYFENLSEDLLVSSPYFVPGKLGVAFFSDLVKKGIRVRILTNSLSSNDVGLVHSGYSKYRKILLKNGIELYELNKKIPKAEGKRKKIYSSNSSLHTKSFVFDKKILFIGSLNLDPRSIIHNTEIGVIIKSEKLAKHMTEKFDENMEKYVFKLELKNNKILWHGYVDGEKQTLDVDPYTSFWKRLGIKLLSFLPIESQL